ncbi:MAG: DUF975 family protein [Erysipelotrichaceae bacterium]
MDTIDKRAIRKDSLNLTFKRGFVNWRDLTIICFVFSFLGISYSFSTSFISIIDKYLGLSSGAAGNVEIIRRFVLKEWWLADSAIFDNQFFVAILDKLLSGYSWLINLLAANFSYFLRNKEEVWVTLLLAAFISFVVQFFIKDTIIIGKCRYLLEHRFNSKTLYRRAIAPFHKENLLNLIWVRFQMKVEMLFSWLLIVPGIIKTYQYRFIPYILAENPTVDYRNAKRLAKELSNGYKWQLFLTDLTFLDFYLLSGLQLFSIPLCAPLLSVKNAEIYLVLRNKRLDEENKQFFIERGFDFDNENSQFRLADIVHENTDKLNYDIYDLITIFFLFCFIGWLWEVLLHFMQSHQWVNRGTMYGPWLPIYGCGGVLFIILLDGHKKGVVRTFFKVVLIAGLLEFVSSWVLEFFFNMTYWDYYGWFGNLNGRICLASLTAFGIGGSMAIYLIGPYVKSKLAKIPLSVKRTYCVILVILFLLDLICCGLFGFNSGEGIGNSL